MKRFRFLIALGAFLLPFVVRTFWFYQYIYQPTLPVIIPNYETFSVPAPPIGTDHIEADVSDAAGKVILLDWAHDNQFGISELEGLIGALNTWDVKVEIVQDTYSSSEQSISERFKYASAYVVIAPETEFSSAEIQQIARFIERGGRLLVICDPTRSENSLTSFELGYYLSSELGGVAAANSLLAPFDLVYSEDYLYNLLDNEGNYRNVLFHDFAEDPLTKDISTVVFYGVRSISTNTGTTLITGDQDTLSSRTDKAGEWGVAARSKGGGVIALGDLTFLTPPYNEVADNPLLINRLVEFLLGGELQRDLIDFPFLFHQPVAILETDSFGLSAETLRYISRMEGTLDKQNLPLTIVDDPYPGIDLIVPNLYQHADEIQSFLTPFDELILPMDSDDGNLTVPDLGELNPAGIGLMLLSRSEVRTTLVMLAASSDDLLALVDIFTDSDLSDCLIREQIALCKVGASEGFMFGDEFESGDVDIDFEELTTENIPLTDEPLSPTPVP